MNIDQEIDSFDPESSPRNNSTDHAGSGDSIYDTERESKDEESMDETVPLKSLHSKSRDIAEYSHTLKAMKIRDDRDLTHNLLKVAEGKIQEEGRYQIWTRWPLLPEDVPRCHPKYTAADLDQCDTPLGQEILATAEKCIKEHLRDRNLDTDDDELRPSFQNAAVSTGLDDVQRMLDVCRVFRKTSTKDANRQRPLDWKSMLSAAELSGLPKEAIDVARNKLTKIYDTQGQAPPDRLAIMHRLLAENDRHIAALSSDILEEREESEDQDENEEDKSEDGSENITHDY